MKYLAICVSSVLCGFLSLSVEANTISVPHSNNVIEDQLTKHSNLVKLNDEELSQTQGQALFNLEYLAAGQAGNPYSSASNIGFYTLSMEAEVRLNANIKSLQVGCGGVNGSNGCDLDIQNFSLGCITNTAGVCITLPKTYAIQPNGVAKANFGSGAMTTAQEASGSIPTSPMNSGLQNSGASGDVTQAAMRDFVINNPFFQFAIRNPDNAAIREVIGLRIGGAQVSGPMSFGSLNSFSGYLTGQANLDMQEMGKGRNPNFVAVTCGPSTAPCKGSGNHATGVNAFGLDGDQTLGLANGRECVLGVICEEYRNLRVSFDGVQKTGLPVAVNGNRVTQAMVSNLELSNVVDSIANSLRFEDSAGINENLLNLIKGIIIGNVKDNIKNQLATGLGTTVANLNSYVMPYNLSNVHQLEVDSPVFGIALSKEALQYPGYVAEVPRGWSMYIPDGFTLNISDPTTRLVSNIVAGAGSSGNIALLPAPYRNCYGSLTFC